MYVCSCVCILLMITMCIQLLEYEPSAEVQVHRLLDMSEVERALDKAIASGDTDLGDIHMHITCMHS